MYYNRALKIAWILTILIVFTLFHFATGMQAELTLKELHSSNSKNMKQLDVISWPQINIVIDQQVFMIHSVEDTPSPQREGSPPNTPVQVMTRSKIGKSDRSSQPTMGTHLTSDQKIRRRVRSISERSDTSALSNRSRSSAGSKKDTKKRDYKPKAVTASGIHFLDPQKKRCSLNYIDDFLDSDEAARMLKSLNEGIKMSTFGHSLAGLKMDLEEPEPF